MNVQGKVVLITGGAGALGAGMAKALLDGGARVYLLDLNRTQGEETASMLSGDVSFIQMNITEEAAWKAVIAQVLEEEGRIDVLINNAGINIRKSIEDMSLEEFNTMMSVNVSSVFLGIQSVIPVMRAQGGGSIINTSSVCGLIGHKFTPEAYTTTKGAVTLLTKSIASRYGKENIRCNSVHPSTVETPLVAELFSDPAKKQERIDEVPLGRLASIEDVAQAVMFLASTEAQFINGVALPVDGGVTSW